MTDTKPKERPILFSGAMVRALIEGSKTQTRRIVKDNPPTDWVPVVGCYHPTVVDKRGEEVPGAEVFGASDENYGRVCPYGQPGDRLWVRETWGVVSGAWAENGNLTDWTPDRPTTAINEMPFGSGYYSGHVIYAADGSHEWAGDDDGFGERSAWHPSIHMPRAASRILLEITAVRVERLQDISEADAIAEGCRNTTHLPCGRFANENFEHLWWSIHGDDSWEANPWVWVVEFQRVEAD